LNDLFNISSLGDLGLGLGLGASSFGFGAGLGGLPFGGKQLD
jgi:hypothetical protein